MGNLDTVREYCDVRDTVRAYRLLLERGESGEAYNVATGRGHSLKSLLDQLIAISRVEGPRRADPARMRARDSDHLIGDPGSWRRARGGRRPSRPSRR